VTVTYTVPCGVTVTVPVTVHDWPVVSVWVFCPPGPPGAPGPPCGGVTWQTITPATLVNVIEKVPFAVFTVTVTCQSVPRMAATPLGTVTL